MKQDNSIKSIYLILHSFALKNILFLFFFLELISNLVSYSGYNFRVSLILKFLFCLFLLNFNLKKNKNFLKLVFALSISILFSLIINYDKSSPVEVTERIVTFFKYLFFLFPFFLFRTKLLDKSLINTYDLQFRWVFIINYIFIIVAFIFDLSFFRTYDGARFGFNGVFISQNISSYILLISFFYFFYDAVVYNKRYDYYLLVISLLAMVLTGTKTVYFGLVLFLGLYLLIKRSKAVFYLLVFSLCLIFIIGLNQSIFSSFYQLYLEKDFWYSFTSFRSEYVNTRFIYNIENFWDIEHYLFGGAFLPTYRLIEMSFFDMFLFFGTIGTLIYSYTIYNLLKVYINGAFLKIILFVLLLASFFSGHFFMSGSVSIYLVIFIFLIKNKNDSGNIQSV